MTENRTANMNPTAAGENGQAPRCFRGGTPLRLFCAQIHQQECVVVWDASACVSHCMARRLQESASLEHQQGTTRRYSSGCWVSSSVYRCLGYLTAADVLTCAVNTDKSRPHLIGGDTKLGPKLRHLLPDVVVAGPIRWGPSPFSFRRRALRGSRSCSS